MLTGVSEKEIDMARTFSRCVKLRDLSKTLLEESERMSLIALNAEIAASRAQGNKEAFGVLAKEAGQLAKQMGRAIDALRGEADGLARRALGGVVESRAHRQMTNAFNRLSEGASREAVRIAMGRHEAELNRITEDINRIEATCTNRCVSVSRYNERAARISIYFRIESSRDEASTKDFAGILEVLSQLHASMSKTLLELKTCS